MSSKYVRLIYKNNDIVFIFPKIVSHNEFVASLNVDRKDIISAGFASLFQNHKNNIVYKCFGNSTSLNKKSLPEDSRIATRQHYSDLDIYDFAEIYD